MTNLRIDGFCLWNEFGSSVKYEASVRLLWVALLVIEDDFAWKGRWKDGQGYFPVYMMLPQISKKLRNGIVFGCINGTFSQITYNIVDYHKISMKRKSIEVSSFCSPFQLGHILSIAQALMKRNYTLTSLQSTPLNQQPKWPDSNKYKHRRRTFHTTYNSRSE